MQIIIDTIHSQTNNLPPNVFKDLFEYLSIKVENSHRTDAFKEGRWDGTKPYLSKTGKFYTGLLTKVIKFLEQYGEIELIDNRKNEVTINDEIDICMGDKTLYPEQERAVTKLKRTIEYNNISLPYLRGVYDFATNAGKSYVCFGIVNNTQKAKTIILVHRKELKDQIYELLLPFFDVGIVHGKKLELDKEVVIAMVKTLYNKAKDIDVVKKLHTFNVLIADEVHTTGGTKQSIDVIKKIKYADVRIGMSGTPFDNLSSVINLNTMGMFGGVIDKISNKELVALGRSEVPSIYFYKNISMFDRPFSYEEAIYYNIHTSINRINIIIDILRRKSDKYIVVTFNNIEHGKFMYDKILESGVIPQDQIALIHGTSSNRTSSLKDFKEGRISVLIASQILKEGVNLPLIEVIINAHGGKSVISIKQYILGRSARKYKGEGVEVIDFYDEGRWVEDHSKLRMKIYKDEGFDITMVK